jgi:rod shape-determining protein MreC
VADYFQSERALRAEIERLRTQQLLLLARLQQFEALEAENERLRKMLGSAARVADRVLAAEVLEVSTEPYTRKLVVNKGSKDGVYVGQPVIDAQGVVGQVTQVAAHQARITLITDPGHAIPVLVNRTGLRAIAFGTGEAERLRVPHLSHEVDIREGDLLVTSGLGGTFPAGYPVAEVIRVIKDPDEAFLDVRARPLALLAMNQRVLLIWPGARQAQGRQP